MDETPAANNQLGMKTSYLLFLPVLYVLARLVLSQPLMDGDNYSPKGAFEHITLPDWKAVTSTVSRECLIIATDRMTVKSAEEKVMLLYRGTPEKAYLVLTSCGVKPGKHHTIYLNGWPVAQVTDDSHNTCNCKSTRQPITYTLSNPGVVVSGWNYISITNDADVTDSWIAYNVYLVIEGELAGAVMGEFTFTSSYDGSSRLAAYQVPISYDSSRPTPLLVSIGGTGEDRWDALFHYAGQANDQGWLLMAPDVRQVHKEWGGRTASLATQHDIIDAINYMKAHFNIDANRIYMSGFSTGGGVAATVAAKYPHVFAAVVDWIGPTDFLKLIAQRPELYLGLVNHDFGCFPEDDPVCRFEWQRRGAQALVMNLKHVPMAIVHGRADDRIPFSQSEDFYKEMQKYYEPLAHNKVAVWHDGGHFDAVPALHPLAFLSQFQLNASPQDIMIKTDESKDYYWVHILQKDWNGQKVEGFSNVVASYDFATGVISATVWDERLLGEGNLPLDVTFDLQAMGLDAEATYVIQNRNLATGEWGTKQQVLPVKGRLTLSASRDALGKVHYQYIASPLQSWRDQHSCSTSSE